MSTRATVGTVSSQPFAPPRRAANMPSLQGSSPVDRFDGDPTDPAPPTPPPSPDPPAPPPPPSNPQPGSQSIGDPYYPQLGNGGYKSQHYTVDIDVDPQSNAVNGSTTLDATATQDLSAFSLDFRGFDVAKVTVNGKDATFSRQDSKLVITPADALHNGDNFSVNVAYSGNPGPVSSEAIPMTVGWKNFGNAISVDCEPDGASAWVPCNDHPRDKATWTFKVSVPDGYLVAANGVAKDPVSADGKTTYQFDMNTPMASYLGTVQIGSQYLHEETVSKGGVPISNYFPSDMADACRTDVQNVGDMIDYFSTLMGPYPFEKYGNFILAADGLVGGALECQSMSIFDNGFITGDNSNDIVFAHELMHQWTGDSTSVENWKDIFLNEGWASYGEWLWIEKTQGSEAVDSRARQVYDWLQTRQIDKTNDVPQPQAVKELLLPVRGRQLGKSVPHASISIGNPPPDDLFDEQVYLRGGLTLYALRKKVGDDAFFSGVKDYIANFKNGNASIDDFQKCIEKSSGTDLHDFFQGWLYQPELPAFPS
jgi:aminopeptidase N